MQDQYLIIAEQVTFRNNKLSAINIWDRFMALQLPSNFNFDIAFVCGPNWEKGEYDLKIKAQVEGMEAQEIGSIKVNILEEKQVFNATAQNLNFMVDKNVKNIKFIAEVDGEEKYSRDYPVYFMFEVKQMEQPVAV